MSGTFIELPVQGGGGGAGSWKDPVATFADLPASGNTDGDTRVVIDENTPYIWNGVSWNAVSGGGASDSFNTIQTDAGTAPVATSPTDVLTLTSSDGSLTITGNSATDTVTMDIKFPILAPEAAGPTYAFSESGNDTGMYSTGDGNISFNSNGGLAAEINGGDLHVIGNISAANFPPTGNANHAAYYDGAGALSSWSEFQRDTVAGGVNFYNPIQPNNGGGATLHSWNANFDPLQNSPAEDWLVHNVYVQFDINSSGFAQGTGGAAATIYNAGFNHQGTGDIGGLTYANFNSTLGNGTDPISVNYLTGLNLFSNFSANVTIQNQLQGLNIGYNVNAGAFGSSNFSVTDANFNSNIQIPVNGYINLNCGPQIAEITTNHNFTGYNLNPTITTFSGNAGFNGIAINGNLGTFDTNGFIGVNVNPTIALNKNYATGIDVNMSNVTTYTGVKSSVTIQDLYFQFNAFGNNDNLTIEYINDGTAGSETVNFSYPAITVHMQSGVSTATQIKTALEANFTIASNLTITITGVGSNPQVTQGATNFAGGANPGTVRAANFTGDVNINGSLAFTGGLNVGQINAYAAYTVPSGAGVVSIDSLITAPSVAASATISGTDLLAINTASLMAIGDNATVTSSFLGWAALGLPAVLSMGTGSTIDRVGGAAFALSLDAAATGGTVDIVSLCRALAIPNASTTVNRLYGYEFSMPFGAVGTQRWGFYNPEDSENFFKTSIKIGGIAGSTDVVSNSSVALEIESSTRAFLNARMTSTERDALTALNGMQIYNTTTDKLQAYAGGSWVDLH